MNGPGKILGVLALGGVLTGLAIGMVSLFHDASPPPPADFLTSLGPPIVAKETIPATCRTTTQADPRCTAVWEEHRHRFFGETAAVSTQTASGQEERP